MALVGNVGTLWDKNLKVGIGYTLKRDPVPFQQGPWSGRDAGLGLSDALRPISLIKYQLGAIICTIVES